MPEGHSIHRLARAFADGFTGQVVRVSSPQGRFERGAELLDGRRLVATDAWGKQLFLGFAPAEAPEDAGADPATLWLRVHLGMYGAWTFAGDAQFTGPHAIGAPRVRIAEEETAVADDGEPSPAGEWRVPPPRGAVRARIVGDHGVADLTGPMACEVLDGAAAAREQARLGPDPLRPDADREVYVRAVRSSPSPVGVLLTDQTVIAGIGNIFRAELLFRSRIYPRRPGARVSAVKLRRVWDEAVELMSAAADSGRIVTTDAADRTAADERWYVYHRDGQDCLRCGWTVRAYELATRRVYWCPNCQRNH
ncbi:DNA glycosylase/AP lyase, H2TH DNA-binding [Beutenbergia cavernae DSM 12333]|uniref:DNA-(apurinic or apyrimidinic site) lyase n=1 Tax=Beutenbergia cavernae (strain ATCC BAA-8 / DSM 12333 / CCUG 43141 / JCM 11478 / NBRC 16432 / NCIMB 13614 / HKI 0122) TaxID=471853 RepID=C5BXH6_BEUC1|nr:DNA-formamidopyrimidine glycosylase family protein [Beutenbergia cavernae]ACQ80859.1 DNA glycosylase/AP lyase, H2TH DNA-binding [Beutenbergia cavernae DSM 12333]